MLPRTSPTSPPQSCLRSNIPRTPTATPARDLLESSARGDNPFDGMTPSVPTGEDLEYGDEEYKSMEKLGLEVIPAPIPTIKTLKRTTRRHL